MTAQPPVLDGRTSVQSVAAFLKEWISLRTPGVVWVRYQSDLSRDLMLSLIDPKLQRLSFAPPQPNEAAAWLEAELGKFAGTDAAPGILAVLFPPLKSGATDDSQQPIWESFRMLNLRRESIFRLPLVQIWCVPAPVAARAQLEAPDLASWFHLKFWLDELPEPGRWGDSLIPADWSAEEIGAFSANLPQNTVALREMKVAAAKRQLAKVDPDDLQERASILHRLGVALAGLGKREQALAAVDEAVALRRRLVAESRDAHLPGLAYSLMSLTARLSDLGNHQAALMAAEESVEILRTLAAKEPGAFIRALAGSLDNLATSQRMMGQQEEALASALEAVEILRQLVKDTRGQHQFDLARSLANLAIFQSEIGKRDEALETALEVARWYGELAKANADVALPYLAASLNNLAITQSDAGKLQDALATAQQAVEVRRKLAHGNPDAFFPDLARSLFVLGDCLAASGKLSEAAGNYRESISVLRELYFQLPAAHAQQMEATVNAYLAACEKTAQPPDFELLNPITHALAKLKPSNPQPPTEAP